MKKDTMQREPARALSTNFNDVTFARAVRAKRRAERQANIKEFFSMKAIIKRPIGTLVAIAAVIVSGVGVYAAANWFNGSVKVTQTDPSILTVDVSECKEAPMPGIEPSADRSNLQFKITGTPHISADELQRKLLVECEFFNTVKVLEAKNTQPYASLRPAIIKSIDRAQRSVTVATWGDAGEKTYSLAANAFVLDKGAESSIDALKVGDFITLSYHLPRVLNEDEHYTDFVSTLDGVFINQYDTREFMKDAKSLYSAGKIMPLEQYKGLSEQAKKEFNIQ